MATNCQCRRASAVDSPRRMPLVAALVAVLIGWTQPSVAQVTLEEVNPNQSTLHPSDPDGASGGRVNGLARATDSVFFAASEWGGLYKSSDRGRTWARLNAHLPTVTWDVEVSPADSSRVFASSLYDGRVSSLAGINVSVDGGVTWTHPASATPPAGFCRSPSRFDEPSAFGISVDASNPQNVYVGTNCGLAISNDGGATWRYVDPTPADKAGDVWDVLAHHGVIDLCGDDGHRRSGDGGATWTTAGAGGTPLPSGRCSLAASPDEGHVLFAVVGVSIFETDDGGGTWNTQFANPMAQGRIPFVATNNRAGANFDLWFGDVSLFRAQCRTPSPPAPGGTPRCPASSTWAGGFTRSAGAHDDTGDVAFARPAGADDINQCLSDCADERAICLGEVGALGGLTRRQCIQLFRACTQVCRRLADGGCPVLMSSDGGVYYNTLTASPVCHTPRWQQPDVTPHGLWLFGMGGARRGGVIAEDLYFGNQDNGTFATQNAGSSPPTWANRDCCDGFDIAAGPGQVAYTVCCFSPAPANRLFVRNSGMVGGQEIGTYPPGTLPGFGFIDIVDRFGPSSYVALTTSGVFVTTNITATPVSWTQLGAATSPANACGVRASGTTPNPTFYVQAGNCSGSAAASLWRYVGTAGNGTWQRVNPPGGAAAGFGIFAVDRADPNRLFASQIMAAGPQMIRSNDGGATWLNDPTLDTLMTGNGAFRYRSVRGPTNFTGFGGYAQPTLLAFDPDDANTLVAGGADSGLFLSRNGGASWTVMTNNSGTPGNPHVPRPRFAHFDRDCRTVSIYVGTQGRGVWRVRYTEPVDPADLAECFQDCASERAECMADVGRPGGLTARQCMQLFSACRRGCRLCP